MSLPPQSQPQPHTGTAPQHRPPMPAQHPSVHPYAHPGAAHLQPQAVAPPRPPLTDAERRRLRRIGAASGALLGVGTGLGGIIVAFWATVLGLSAVFTPLVYGFGGGNPLEEGFAEVVTPLTVAVFAIGTLLSLLGIALSWAQLRRWGAGRALGITAAAALIALIPVHVTNLVIVVLSFVLQLEFDESVGIALIALVGGFAGVVIGAAGGSGAWRWMGGALRPLDPARRG